jgi:hypothetical protein
MAIDPFSRRALTPDEWRAKAQRIQSELERLTINELMRGGRANTDARGGSGGRGARGYNPNQPRVSAGHPDGGQWTGDDDDLDDYDWAIDVAGVGHHWYARHFYRRYPFSRETRRVFRNATSGPLVSRLWSRRRNEWLVHGRGYDRAHREYDRAVDELMTRYMRERGITAQQMTPTQAHDVVELIKRSDDPRIRSFVRTILILRRFFRRYGPRGNE